MKIFFIFFSYFPFLPDFTAGIADVLLSDLLFIY